MNDVKTSKQQAAYNRAREVQKINDELLAELYFYQMDCHRPSYGQQVDFSERAPTPDAEGWQGLGA